MPNELKDIVFLALDKLAFQHGTLVCLEWKPRILTAAKKKIHAELCGLIEELIQNHLSTLPSEVLNGHVTSTKLRGLFKNNLLDQSTNLSQLKKSQGAVLHLIKKQLMNIKVTELDLLIEQSKDNPRIYVILNGVKQDRRFRTFLEIIYDDFIINNQMNVRLSSLGVRLRAFGVYNDKYGLKQLIQFAIQSGFMTMVGAQGMTSVTFDRDAFQNWNNKRDETPLITFENPDNKLLDEYPKIDI
jgi:hypothetical protein